MKTLDCVTLASFSCKPGGRYDLTKLTEMEASRFSWIEHSTTYAVLARMERVGLIRYTDFAGGSHPGSRVAPVRSGAPGRGHGLPALSLWVI